MVEDDCQNYQLRPVGEIIQRIILIWLWILIENLRWIYVRQNCFWRNRIKIRILIIDVIYWIYIMHCVKSVHDMTLYSPSLTTWRTYLSCEHLESIIFYIHPLYLRGIFMEISCSIQYLKDCINWFVAFLLICPWILGWYCTKIKSVQRWRNYTSFTIIDCRGRKQVDNLKKYPCNNRSLTFIATKLFLATHLFAVLSLKIVVCIHNNLSKLKLKRLRLFAIFYKIHLLDFRSMYYDGELRSL